MKAMLLAAGLGTRLKPFTDHHPKALAKVNGICLLERNITYLKKYGINDIIINIHHFGEQIIDFIADNNQFNCNIHFSDERDEVLETGGGVKKALPFYSNDEALLVMNADILTSLNLDELIKFHKSKNALASLAVMDRTSSRQLIFDNNMQLCGWINNVTHEEKTARNTENKKLFSFSGIQIVSPKIWENTKFSGKFSIIDTYLDLAKEKTILGYNHSGDILLDVGKLDSIAQAEKLFT